MGYEDSDSRVDGTNSLMEGQGYERERQIRYGYINGIEKGQSSQSDVVDKGERR